MGTATAVLLFAAGATSAPFGEIVGRAPAQYAEDIAMCGDTVYVTGKEAGLFVFDVSDPAAPALVRTIRTLHAWDLCATETRLYLADYSGGLRIYDLSRPGDPAEAGVYAPGWTVIQVAVDEPAGRAYIGGGDGSDGRFEVLDISDLGAIRRTGEHGFHNAVSSLAVRGSTAFCGQSEGTLTVIDVADAGRIAELGRYRNEETESRRQWALGIFLDGDALWLSDWGAGAIRLDITQPENPRETSRYVEDGYSFYDVWASGDRAYVAGDRGLCVVDTSDSASLRLVGQPISTTIDTDDKPHGVVVRPDLGLAFVADNGEQKLVVVSVRE